jgi:hypothetical protein
VRARAWRRAFKRKLGPQASVESGVFHRVGDFSRIVLRGRDVLTSDPGIAPLHPANPRDLFRTLERGCRPVDAGGVNRASPVQVGSTRTLPRQRLRPSFLTPAGPRTNRSRRIECARRTIRPPVQRRAAPHARVLAAPADPRSADPTPHGSRRQSPRNARSAQRGFNSVRSVLGERRVRPLRADGVLLRRAMPTWNMRQKCSSFLRTFHSGMWRARPHAPA